MSIVVERDGFRWSWSRFSFCLFFKRSTGSTGWLRRCNLNVFDVNDFFTGDSHRFFAARAANTPASKVVSDSSWAATIWAFK
jgi:hypothetical protein